MCAILDTYHIAGTQKCTWWRDVHHLVHVLGHFPCEPFPGAKSTLALVLVVPVILW